jgi:hypothetical protein
MAIASAVAWDGCEGEIPITNQIPRPIVPGESLSKLLRGPCRRRMFRNRHMHDAAALVRKHHEDKQQPAGGRGYHEEVGRHDLVDVIGQERPPRLGRRSSRAREVF